MQARTKVTLRIRIRSKTNNRVYATPVYSNNNKLRPLWALVDGIAEHHPEGKYQLRYRSNGRRVWEDVGSDADVAFTAKLRREHMQQSQALGLSPPDSVATKRILLKDGAAEYLEDIAGRRAKKTFQAYALALHYFQESCSKTYLDQIERTDLLQFMRFLPRTHGLSPRTVFNQVRDIVSFLRNFKVCGLIAGTDLPRYTEKKVSAYTRAELQCLFRASTAEETFAFQFFLGTGGRDQEVSFSGYDDVNFETKTIHFRKQATRAYAPSARLTPNESKTSRKVTMPSNL